MMKMSPYFLILPALMPVLVPPTYANDPDDEDTIVLETTPTSVPHRLTEPSLRKEAQILYARGRIEPGDSDYALLVEKKLSKLKNLRKMEGPTAEGKAQFTQGCVRLMTDSKAPLSTRAQTLLLFAEELLAGLSAEEHKSRKILMGINATSLDSTQNFMYAAYNLRRLFTNEHAYIPEAPSLASQFFDMTAAAKGVSGPLRAASFIMLANMDMEGLGCPKGIPDYNRAGTRYRSVFRDPSAHPDQKRFAYRRMSEADMAYIRQELQNMKIQ